MIDVFGPIKGGISAGDKKVAMRVFLVIFCTFFVPGVSLFFLVKTGFNYNSFPLFFLALIFIAFFVILGVKRLITLNLIDVRWCRRSQSGNWEARAIRTFRVLAHERCF